MQYTPEVGEFEAPIDLYVFDDGWKIVEVRTEKDLATVGRTTRNCIGASWAIKIITGNVEDDRALLREQFRAQWDTPYNRERHGDEWVEKMVASADKCPLPNRQYKIGALIDDEGRVHAALMLGEKNAVDGRCTYATYRDLGQFEMLMPLDGCEFYLLQATMGTAWMPEQVAMRCAEWWKAQGVGTWNEEAFQAKVDSYNRTRAYRPAMAYR